MSEENSNFNSHQFQVAIDMISLLNKHHTHIKYSHLAHEKIIQMKFEKIFDERREN